MARRKIRNYPSTNFIRDSINKYFEQNKEDVINELLSKTGFDTVDELYYHEYHDNNGLGLSGLDLGWVWVKTYNAEQNREWILDNGKYDNMVRGINCPYDSQSTTIKKFQIDKALKDMKLNDNYYSYVRLD